MAGNNRRKWIFGVVCLMALMTAAYFGWRFWESRQADELILYGNVDIRQVDLGFRVAGRIAEVLVEEGQEVETGEPLARLDRDVLEQQLDLAKARLEAASANLARLEKGYRVQEIAQARASVASARAAAENAAINLRRIRGLRVDNAVSQKDLDNARASDREARAALASAEEQFAMLSSGYREEEVRAQIAEVAASRAQLRKAEIELADGELKSPQKGVVLTRAREAGAIVNAGQTVYTLTLTDPLWLLAYVSEPDLGKIKPGMAVEVAVDAAPGQRFPGWVGFISPTAEFTPKTVETPELRTSLVYRIRIRAKDPENLMRQGMPVTIFITSANESSGK